MVIWLFGLVCVCWWFGWFGHAVVLRLLVVVFRLRLLEIVVPVNSVVVSFYFNEFEFCYIVVGLRFLWFLFGLDYCAGSAWLNWLF